MHDDRADEDDAGLSPLHDLPQSLGQDMSGDGSLTAAQAWCLYVSHFLSMWNSRIYEYAGVLFAHATFPGTLLPTSLIGISETVCMIAVSAAMGQWIDASPGRLRPLVASIAVNRITLGLCCLLWVVIAFTTSTSLKQTLFGVILTLGMVEKLTRMSNVLSMERDWIPTVADQSRVSGSQGYSLTHLNTIIRRIDISCKFMTPLAASGLMAGLSSPDASVPLIIGLFSLASVAVEVAGLLWVWNRNSTLRAPKPRTPKLTQPWRVQTHDLGVVGMWHSLCRSIAQIATAQIDGVKFYFSTDVWVPSFGIALLHASVLDWAGTLITWLLNAGFTYSDVTLAKGVGTIFEVGSTFVFPIAVGFFMRRMPDSTDKGTYQMVNKFDEDQISHEEDEEPFPHVGDDARSHTASLRPIIEVGRWGICSLLAMILPAVIVLFWLDAALGTSPRADVPTNNQGQSAFPKAPLPTILFFSFLSFSFVGRWVYDLSVTQLTQVSITENQRSEFGGAEMAIIASFQFAHWVASALWSDQADFKWLGTMSLFAVAMATAGFMHWHKKQKTN